jgi:hypothetical protein
MDKTIWLTRLLARVAFERAELPLTINVEKRLYFDDSWKSLHGSNPPFNLLLSLEFMGELNIRKLKDALDELVHRQEIFRSILHIARDVSIEKRKTAVLNFVRTGTFAPGLFRHSIMRSCATPLSIIDFESGQKDYDHLLESIGIREILSPIPLDRAPLFRATLIKLSSTRHVLLIAISHLISDAISLNNIKTELRDIYVALAARKRTAPSDSSFQFSDFAAWQQSFLRGPASEPSIEYWRQQWSLYEHAAVPCEPMVTPLDMRSKGTGKPNHVESFIDETTSKQLKEFAKSRRITPFMLFFASLGLAIASVNNRDEVGIWVSLSNRTLRNSERGIGWFVNTHLLCVDLSHCAGIEDLLSRVRNTVLSGIKHQRVPAHHIWNIAGRIPLRLRRPGSVRFEYARSDSSLPFPLNNSADPELHLVEKSVLREPGIPDKTLSAKVLDNSGRLELSIASDGNLVGSEALHTLMDTWNAITCELAQSKNDFLIPWIPDTKTEGHNLRSRI